ncbi:MAG TPA: hypothetical protein VG649_02275 [Candidatus Angelobacter sp.]|jgi:hypothetical protein|nr:hypothetical protein [Candidatus Angelobacter sp.]
MSNENERSEEFKRFDAAVSHIMSVPKSEIDKRLEKTKKDRAKKKRTKKSASPASDA